MKKMFVKGSLIVLALFIAHTAYAEINAKTAPVRLVDSKRFDTSDRISTLEREVQDLEKENRYQDERIRMLERAINEVRRRS